MKKRLIALCLIGALLAFPGCKNGETENFGVTGVIGGTISGNTGGNPSGGDTAPGGETQTPGTAEPGTGGEQATPGTGENNTGSTPAGPTAGNQTSGGGQASLGETFGAGTPIPMKAGETIWFGPVSAEQAAQLTFTGGSTSSGGGAAKVEDLGGGFAIYSFKAPADGTATPAVGDKYKDVFLVAKSAMDLGTYFGHWDNIKGRNLYDQRFDKTGKWLDASGKLENSKAGNATHAIPVQKGETLTFGPVRAGQPVLGYGYDSAMNPVALVNGYGLGVAFTFDQGMKAFTYTVPEGVAFVRFNVNEDEADLFAVMKNNVFDAAQYQRLTGAKTGEAGDPLFKRTCLFIGDSICAAGADTGNLKGWARRVQEAAGAECYNAGISGAALSDCRVHRPSATKNHQIYKQLEDYNNSDFDYILIHGGVNDAWDSREIGSVSRGYDPAGFDLTTYAGGLEMAIYTAVDLYGDTAAIGYLMNFQLPQNAYGKVASGMGEYFEVGKQICDKWGISYFDMYNHKGITAQLAPTTTKYLPDGTHPNAGGYDVLGPFITDYMRTMTPVTQGVLEDLANQ